MINFSKRGTTACAFFPDRPHTLTSSAPPHPPMPPPLPTPSPPPITSEPSRDDSPTPGDDVEDLPPPLGIIYVKASEVHGGGVFASGPLRRGERIAKYTGITVAKETMGAPGYRHGYVMRVGGRFVDARDPDGRLVLQDGTTVNVHCFTAADWAALPAVGVRWEGAANLSRFINQTAEKGTANVTFSRGWWRTTVAVDAHTELLLSSQLMPRLPNEQSSGSDAAIETVRACAIAANLAMRRQLGIPDAKQRRPTSAAQRRALSEQRRANAIPSHGRTRRPTRQRLPATQQSSSDSESTRSSSTSESVDDSATVHRVRRRGGHRVATEM